jgi:hypothetical protein
MKTGMMSSAVVAALTGLGAMTQNADAADFRFNFNLGFGGHGHHGHVQPGPRYERVWVPPVYETRIRQVWCAPVYETRCREVYIPAVTRCEYYTYRDHCGRLMTGTRTVIVAPARTDTVHERVLVTAGHYDTVREQVLVRAGYWTTVCR